MIWKTEMRLVSEEQRSDFVPFPHRPRLELGSICGGDTEG